MSEKSYKYICEKCNYKSNIPSQWEKHINIKKVNVVQML